MSNYRMADKIITTSAVPATEAAGVFYGTVWLRSSSDPATAATPVHSVPAETEPDARAKADEFVVVNFPQAVKERDVS